MLTTFLAILGKLRFDAKGCVCSLLVGDPELDNGLIIVNIVSINQRLPFQRERPYLGSGPTSLLTPSQEGLKDPSGTSQCSKGAKQILGLQSNRPKTFLAEPHLLIGNSGVLCSARETTASEVSRVS